MILPCGQGGPTAGNPGLVIGLLRFRGPLQPPARRALGRGGNGLLFSANKQRNCCFVRQRPPARALLPRPWQQGLAPHSLADTAATPSPATFLAGLGRLSPRWLAGTPGSSEDKQWVQSRLLLTSVTDRGGSQGGSEPRARPVRSQV